MKRKVDRSGFVPCRSAVRLAHKITDGGKNLRLCRSWAGLLSCLDDGTASIALVLSVAEYFGLPSNRAKVVVREVAKAVGNWRRQTADLGIAGTEIEKMSSAFDHEDVKEAGKL